MEYLMAGSGRVQLSVSSCQFSERHLKTGNWQLATGNWQLATGN
jgi:hypothetical protein